MNKGKLITFEGADACGKTSVIRRLNEQERLQAVFTFEPGGTEFAMKQKQILVRDPGAALASPKALLYAFFSARADHFDNLIKPRTDLGEDVISDRLDASTFAFQIYGAENYGLQDLFWRLREETLTVKPHYFYFRIASAKTSERRMVARDNSDRTWFDKKPYEFHQRIIDGYEAFFSQVAVPVTIIDAEQDEQTVYQEVLANVQEILSRS